jgi:Single-strand binding protein family
MAINSVMVIGNLGGDPQTRSLPSGDSVANFSVATTERFKDRDGGKQGAHRMASDCGVRKVGRQLRAVSEQRSPGLCGGPADDSLLEGPLFWFLPTGRRFRCPKITIRQNFGSIIFEMDSVDSDPLRSAPITDRKAGSEWLRYLTNDEVSADRVAITLSSTCSTARHRTPLPRPYPKPQNQKARLRTRKTPLETRILNHWETHHPQMVSKLNKEHRLEQLLHATAERTADLIYG